MNTIELTADQIANDVITLFGINYIDMAAGWRNVNGELPNVPDHWLDLVAAKSTFIREGKFKNILLYKSGHYESAWTPVPTEFWSRHTRLAFAECNLDYPTAKYRDIASGIDSAELNRAESDARVAVYNAESALQAAKKSLDDTSKITSNAMKIWQSSEVD